MNTISFVDLSFIIYINQYQDFTKMLLRNIVEIIRLDEGLTVDAVLVITDEKNVSFNHVLSADFEDALVAVRCASGLRTAPVLIAAISDAMKSNW